MELVHGEGCGVAEEANDILRWAFSFGLVVPVIVVLVLIVLVLVLVMVSLVSCVLLRSLWRIVLCCAVLCRTVPYRAETYRTMKNTVLYHAMCNPFSPLTAT